jgi:hypothetical protein
MSDIDTAAADSLKVLDPKRPTREADHIVESALSARDKQSYKHSVSEDTAKLGPWKSFGIARCIRGHANDRCNMSNQAKLLKKPGQKIIKHCP